MHLYRLETIGSIDGLVAREEAIPVPSAGEVLIRVKASALNFRDLAILLGKSPFPVRPGVVPLSDAAGEVEAVGPDVSTLKVGDRVVSRFFPTWYGGPRTQPDMYGTDRMAGSRVRLFERRRSRSLLRV
jgi:NADPH:quinone reductase-like Zn-dependent oxidoreductase